MGTKEEKKKRRRQERVVCPKALKYRGNKVRVTVQGKCYAASFCFLSWIPLLCPLPDQIASKPPIPSLEHFLLPSVPLSSPVASLHGIIISQQDLW